MKYLLKSFNFSLSGSKQFGENYDRIFRKSLKEKIKIAIEKRLIKLFIEEKTNQKRV